MLSRTNLLGTLICAAITTTLRQWRMHHWLLGSLWNGTTRLWDNSHRHESTGSRVTSVKMTYSTNNAALDTLVSKVDDDATQPFNKVTCGAINMWRRLANSITDGRDDWPQWDALWHPKQKSWPSRNYNSNCSMRADKTCSQAHLLCNLMPFSVSKHRNQ